MNPQEFTSTVLSRIQSGDVVLDLGAGQGRFARMFVEHGARVTAVDPQLPADLDAGITVQRMTVEAFCTISSPTAYTCIFARNVIQFLDKAWVGEVLFPWMMAHLMPGGMIAISTFYHNPDPPFERLMPSLYTLDELLVAFPRWSELLSRQYQHRGPDMSGQLRTFFTTDLIVQSPQ